MSVIAFPSSRGRGAKENLEAFVARARNGVAAFGPDLDFDAPCWDVTGSHVTRGSSGHQTTRLFFTIHEAVASKGMVGRMPFTEPFAAFVKSMVRLREEGGHVSANIHGVTIRASRYLYDAAAACGHDPCGLLPDHFLTAVAACKAREKPSSAYRIGIALAAIADWINRYNLSRVRIDFRNPVERVAYDGSRIGRDAEGRRASRLPSDIALSALPAIANIVEDPADKLRLRCVELLVCGGWRINEILTIRADCEIFHPATEDGEPLLDRSGQQVIRYGISYFAEKGAGPRTKWIPSPMVDMAKRAIADIRRITQPARDTLAWMAANPGRARLPDPWHGRSDTEYGLHDIASMFALYGPDAARLFVKTMGGSFIAGRSPATISRRDLDAALLSRQSPVGRSSVPLRPEQYLFVMPRNWGHRARAVIPSIIDLVSDQQISDLVSGREGVETIFARYGFNNPDGSPITLTTHQFRHWLNTLAQQGGMSQMEIARWSGRKDMGQNAAYDHRSGVEMAAEARKMMAAGKVQGPLAELHGRLPPVNREGFRDMLYTTAHTTDLGMCTNDFSLVPCTEHGACAACTQHLVVKGNAAQRSRAETLLEENTVLLLRAEAEAREETYGASNHVTHLRRTCDALTRILAVHGDPDTPDGNLVQLELATGLRGLGLDVGEAA